jgi:hypothetical protein
MRKGDEVQYQNAEWAEADRKIVGRALRIAAKDIQQRRDVRLKPKGAYQQALFACRAPAGAVRGCLFRLQSERL